MENYKDFKKRMLKNKEVKRAYDELGPEFAIIEKLIEMRLKHGLTQAQLAKRLGTKQSAISRLERGTYNPTLSFLNKLADALDVKIKITVS